MIIFSKILPYKSWQKVNSIKVLGNEFKALSMKAQMKEEIVHNNKNSQPKTNDIPINNNDKLTKHSSLANYRFIYPEFLPDPTPAYRNKIREKLECIDMLARRSVLNIPEFYVGSILAVTYSEPHATAKVNKFVGICILREGAGLRASFILRNVVNGESVEVCYNLYDPVIQKIDCLRLEKRLDNELLYLRDAPLEYSTFPFDMEIETSGSGSVILNEIKIPLNPPPWSQKWEYKDLKGVTEIIVNKKRQRKAKAAAKPWEKYDLMKTYRETIPEEEQVEIFSDIHKELQELEIQKNILKRKYILQRQNKSHKSP